MEAAARSLLGQGVATVLVKLGSKGSLLVTGAPQAAPAALAAAPLCIGLSVPATCIVNYALRSSTVQTYFLVMRWQTPTGACALPAEDGAVSQPIIAAGKVVDTTGAGDCFTAAFAVASQEGQDRRAALRFASAAAGICVSGGGAMPSLPWRSDVDKLLGEQ